MPPVREYTRTIDTDYRCCALHNMAMNTLPPEVLQIILGHIPLLELYQSHVQVCKQWRDTIRREQFMKWQKVYYKYLRGDPTAFSLLKDTCRQADIANELDCFKNLFVYIGSMFPNLTETWKNAEKCLQSHRFYALALQIAKESLVPFIEDNVKPPFWSVVAIICVISHDSWDIYSLLKVLTSPSSELTFLDVTDKFYCLLSFFLHFVNTYNISNRWHYNLFQALHWLKTSNHGLYHEENSLVQLTHEQLRIVHHDLKPNDMLKIIAFAGTGKTTTLIHFTKQNPNMRFLLLMYNRAAADDAARKFPANVKCATIHQMAYKYIDDTYKRNKRIRNLSVFELISSKLLEHDRSGFKRFRREALVLETLNKFLASADNNILLEHAPKRVEKLDTTAQAIFEECLTDQQRKDLVSDALTLWNLIRKPYNKSINMPFDAFLKIWQLEKPNLYQLEKVDCIIVDEGQDMNGAMLDIFLNHSGARVIVGDPHQQIYQWRYAINALDRVSSTHTFYLTQSFRFGPEIGYLASSCLNLFKDVKNKSLVGSEIRDALDRGEIDTSSYRPGQYKQICFLARTNFGLFKKVIQIIEAYMQSTSSPSKKPKKTLKIAFAGGIDKMGFDSIVHLFHLKSGSVGRVRNSFLGRFKNIQDFKQYVEEVGDQEWAAKLAIVEWAGSRAEDYVKAIKELDVDDMSRADVIFSTAHKAKGLEWDIVALLDDFIPQPISHTRMTDEAHGEPNLLYVAVTRAKRHLIINPACYHVLLAVGDRQERIVSTEEHLQKHLSATCSSCSQLYPGRFKSRKASLATLPLQVMTSQPGKTMAFRADILCSCCAGLPWYTYCNFDCYRDRLPMERLREDLNHSALNFMVGPPVEQQKDALIFYAEYSTRMRLNGRRLVSADLSIAEADPDVEIPDEIGQAQADVIEFPDDDYVFDEALCDLLEDFSEVNECDKSTEDCPSCSASSSS